MAGHHRAPSLHRARSRSGAASPDCESTARRVLMPMRMPALPFASNQLRQRFRGTSALPAGFPGRLGGGSESWVEPFSHLSRWRSMSSRCRRMSAKCFPETGEQLLGDLGRAGESRRCPDRGHRLFTRLVSGCAPCADRNLWPLASRYLCSSAGSIAELPSSRRAADSLPLAIALLNVPLLTPSCRAACRMEIIWFPISHVRLLETFAGNG